MHLGTAIYTYLWECSLDLAITRVAELGLRTIEVMTTPPFLWPTHFGPFERRRLLRHLRATGTRISSLNPTFLDLNLVSLNPAIRAASLAEIKETIRLAHDLEAPIVVAAAGRRHPLIPSPFADAEALAVELFGECATLAGQLGVTVGIENLPALFEATSTEVVGLVEQVASPYCRIVYDVANAFMVEDPAVGLRTVAPHLALVHYSDTHRSRWEHLPIGLGEVDFAAATAALREIGYDGTVILETTYQQDPDGGIRSSLAELAALGLRP